MAPGEQWRRGREIGRGSARLWIVRFGDSASLMLPLSRCGFLQWQRRKARGGARPRSSGQTRLCGASILGVRIYFPDSVDTWQMYLPLQTRRPIPGTAYSARLAPCNLASTWSVERWMDEKAPLLNICMIQACLLQESHDESRTRKNVALTDNSPRTADVLSLNKARGPRIAL